MSKGRDITHTLVVTEIDADEGQWEMDVKHPPECKQVEMEPIGSEHSWLDWDCATGRQINWAGFEDFPRPEELGPGEFRFHLWWSGPDYLGEYDGGIEIKA